ncbi:hypothetical protein VTL71DRAFT_15272, partial [Oculimacula yallundae]
MYEALSRLEGTKCSCLEVKAKPQQRKLLSVQFSLLRIVPIAFFSLRRCCRESRLYGYTAFLLENNDVVQAMIVVLEDHKQLELESVTGMLRT